MMMFLGQLLIVPIRLYQRFLSQLKIQPTCRFHPTCSSYAIRAIETFGPLKGLYLSFRRILKCQPFHPGGYDPVGIDGQTEEF
jgi:putative membrane protein insertion efficiency factor